MPPEAPAEKLRNALAILRSHDPIDELADVVLDRPCYARLEILIADVVDELEQLPAPAPHIVHCRFCACTEQQACTVDVDELAPPDRDALEAYFDEQHQELPDKVTCWWISLDPPVCSNPHCAELHWATTSGVQPS